jgi:hypothetical protein
MHYGKVYSISGREVIVAGRKRCQINYKEQIGSKTSLCEDQRRDCEGEIMGVEGIYVNQVAGKP